MVLTDIARKQGLLLPEKSNRRGRNLVLAGGTLTNLTVIAHALKPHQAVITACTGHINVHETGAIEATGHKVLGLPSETEN